MLVGILKGIIALWPFLKELVLGNQELRNHVRRNKVSTFLLVTLFIMFLLFLFIADSAVTANRALQEVTNENKVLKVKLESLEQAIVELRAAREESKGRIDALEKENDSIELRNSELVARLLSKDNAADREPNPARAPASRVRPAAKPAATTTRSKVADSLNRLRELEGVE